MSIRKQPKRGAKLVYIFFAIVMFSLVTAKMNCNIVLYRNIQSDYIELYVVSIDESSPRTHELKAYFSVKRRLSNVVRRFRVYTLTTKYGALIVLLCIE